MRSSCHLRPVRNGDALALAATMREADAAEVLALDATPLSALEGAVGLHALEAWTVELAGEVAAMGGVVQPSAEEQARVALVLPEARGFRVVWLLTGRAVDRHRFAFWRASKQVLTDLLHRYVLLFNLVDARYTASLRWAQRLGAEVRPSVPVGASRLPFHPVLWRSPWAHPEF